MLGKTAIGFADEAGHLRDRTSQLDPAAADAGVCVTWRSSGRAGDRCRLVSVKDSSVAFLQYVTKLGLELSSEIEVQDFQEFDGSFIILIDEKSVSVSKKFAEHVFVEIL